MVRICIGEERDADSHPTRFTQKQSSHHRPNILIRIIDPITQEQTIISFHGCCYHACPKCLSSDLDKDLKHPLTGESMTECYNRTLARTKYLTKQSYKVTTIWEHEYDHLLLDNPEVKAFVNSLAIESPLTPRDSFYGGRAAESFRLS
jgi:G:T-mismatch repair DNA endonuclease (very short patch repair protein)